MTISELASIADILAGLGVIASLIFVGIEVRRNTQQAKLDNWSQSIDRFQTIYANTGNEYLSNLMAKGSKSYKDLSDGEKIAFGHQLEQLCIGLESILHIAGNEVHEKDQMISLFEKHVQHHLGSPGGKEWYKEFQNARGFPPPITDSINIALAKLADS